MCNGSVDGKTEEEDEETSGASFLRCALPESTGSAVAAAAGCETLLAVFSSAWSFFSSLLCFRPVNEFQAEDNMMMDGTRIQ